MKKRNLVLIVLLLLVGITSGYVARTYAKYVSTLTNASSTATVAKWDFKEGTNYGVFAITLPATVNATTLASGRIAPGTSGTFTIDLDNSGSEVGVEFEITFTGASGVPSNLVFTQNATSVLVSNAKITGTIPAGGTLSVPLNWSWPYYTDATDDGEDTTDGLAGGTMTLTAAVSGHQVQPGASAITASYTVGTNS